MKSIVCTLLLTVGAFCANAQSQDKEWLDVNYGGDSNVYHNLDIHLPDANQPSYKPIIVIYGSAWLGNNLKAAGFKELGKPLLEKGFAVVAINHRSSGDAAFPAQINDVKAAIRFLRANAAKYKIDTTFIGITGYSSGGHLSSLAGASNGVKTKTVGKITLDIEGNVGGNNTSHSSNVNAVVDWFGPIDMTRMENCTTTKDDKSPEAALIKGNPADHLDMLALLNPMTYLTKKDPQFVVIHGDADNVVPYCQSEFFAEALKKKGLLNEFILVPKGQHGPITINPQTLQKMADFFVQQPQKGKAKK